MQEGFGMERPELLPCRRLHLEASCQGMFFKQAAIRKIDRRPLGQAIQGDSQFGIAFNFLRAAAAVGSPVIFEQIET